MQENIKYTSGSKITNLIDVVKFFEYLLYEKNLLFHPDDDFSDYAQNEESANTINSDEAEIFNQLMDQCFAVCEEQSMEIYRIGLASMRRLMKFDAQDSIEVGLLARKTGQNQTYKIVEEVKGGYVLVSLSDNKSVLVKESEIVII